MFVTYIWRLVIQARFAKGLIVLFFLTICAIISAKTYYVAPPKATPAGNDRNAGSIEAPWLTWEYAFSQLSAGDTLLIRGGTYQPSEVRWGARLNSKSGTADNEIVIMGYPGETAILDCQNINVTSPTLGLFIANSNHVYFNRVSQN